LAGLLDLLFLDLVDHLLDQVPAVVVVGGGEDLLALLLQAGWK